MMSSYQEQMQQFSPEKQFYVGIDSDGCAFDTMELKHKECFGPNIINHWNLQPVSKYAREAFEFVNLYSRWRGVNRWPALVKVLDLLRERPEVIKRGAVIPQVDALRAFIASGAALSNGGLADYMQAHPHQELDQAMQWSKAVNDSIAGMVRGVAPFPFVRDSLQKLTAQADLVVVSATPYADLEREWSEHGIAAYVRLIAGQEMGTKAEVLAATAKDNYTPDHILMIGDAPGDFKAARANNALFLPINPGYEDESWQRFYEEGIQRFLEGSYAGAYEAGLIAEFETILDEVPPWQK
jgi:phosphoglycolate phosphatase-like HAD superfamily hydrolase